MARVAVLLPSFTVGGAETQALLLSDYLIKKGHHVVLFNCTQGPNRLDQSLLNPSVVCVDHPVHFQHIIQLKPSALRSVLSLSRKFVKYKINVVIPFTLVPNILGNLSGRLAGVKLRLWNQRSVDIVPYGRGEGLSKRFAHHIVGNSNYVIKQLFARWGGKQKPPFKTIYNGRRPKRKATNNNPPPYSPIENSLSIIHLASFFEEKDFATLIRGVHLAIERGSKVHLHLVGRNPGGGVWEACHNLVYQLGLNNYVTFHGGVEDPGRFVRGADLCVLSTTSEGLSNTLIEYALAQKPTLTTNIPPNIELLGAGHPGFFEVGNHTQLAGLIERQAQKEDNTHFVPTLNVPIDTTVMGDSFHQIMLAHLS